VDKEVGVASEMISLVELIVKSPMWETGTLVVETRWDAITRKLQASNIRWKQRVVVSPGPHWKRKSYAFFFNANDQAIAEDVSKAFADASNICRVRVKRTQ
jgi:hypothetical protein